MGAFIRGYTAYKGFGPTLNWQTSSCVRPFLSKTHEGFFLNFVSSVSRSTYWLCNAVSTLGSKWSNISEIYASEQPGQNHMKNRLEKLVHFIMLLNIEVMYSGLQYRTAKPLYTL